MILFLIAFNKVTNHLEDRFITDEHGILKGVENGVVIREGTTLLILKEDAGDVTLSKGIVVAVGRQFASVQSIEIMLISIDFFKQSKPAHAFVADFAVLHRIVVANHVEVEKIADLIEWDKGMLGIKSGAPQVGILTRKSDEIYIVFRLVFGIIGGQSDDGGSTRSIVVGARIKDVFAQIAQMVVVSREYKAAVVTATFHFGDDIKQFKVLEELVVNGNTDALHTGNGLWSHPYNGLLHHTVTVCLVELDG